jgi:hypothetical protein
MAILEANHLRRMAAGGVAGDVPSSEAGLEKIIVEVWVSRDAEARIAETTSKRVLAKVVKDMQSPSPLSAATKRLIT